MEIDQNKLEQDDFTMVALIMKWLLDNQILTVNEYLTVINKLNDIS